MTNIEVLLVEDDAVEATITKQALTDLHYQVVLATTLSDALECYANHAPDLVLLDIILHGQKDGITIAQKINEEAHPPPIIFLTSASDKATFDAAKLTRPYSYLLKPFNPLELAYAIELAVEKAGGEPGVLNESNAVPGQGCFFVKKQGAMFKMLPENIDYIKVEERYCELWMEQEKFLVQSSLKEMSERLSSANFIRIHRNCLVNFERLTSISASDSVAILQDGTQLTISRRYLDEIKRKYPML